MIHPDSEKISVDHPYELRYWKETLDCDELTLRRALAAVGDTQDKVREFIVARKETVAALEQAWRAPLADQFN